MSAYSTSVLCVPLDHQLGLVLCVIPTKFFATRTSMGESMVDEESGEEEEENEEELVLPIDNNATLWLDQKC